MNAVNQQPVTNSQQLVYHPPMPPADPQALLHHVTALQPKLIARLKELVQQESPSDNPAAINAAMALAENYARTIGGRPKYHRQKEHGDVLELRFGPRKSTLKPILLLGHLDTVWPIGTLAQMPWHETPKKISGPGTLDMKAGVIMALTAIEALHSLKIYRPITLLLNSDEEIGSPISRPITERLARESSAVLVLEPAQGLALKTARKGVGGYLVEVTGIAAHSGVDFRRPLRHPRASPPHPDHLLLHRSLPRPHRKLRRHLRRHPLQRSRLPRPGRSRRPHSQSLRRPPRRKLFRCLKPHRPPCKIKITGGINRPPMERKPGTIALFKQAQKLAAQLGFPLEEAATGGGSDGNFTAALGIPTLDGLGAIGAGAHAAHEHILTKHLIPRTALLAALLADINQTPTRGPKKGAAHDLLLPPFRQSR